MNVSIFEGNRRLLQLAQHGRTGQWGHEKFDFYWTNAIECKDAFNKPSYFPQPNKCGTIGCYMGELPILFPDTFIFDERGDPVTTKSSLESIKEFFSINLSELMHLFYPYNQYPEKYGGKSLDGHATKEEVADNIEAFVKIREEKLGPPNARFWIHWNGDLVKLTMKPGDNIGLHCGGRTDEGYYSHYEEYEYDGQKVYCILDTDSVDCDGRFSTSKQFSCEYDDLRGGICVDGVARPFWVKERSSQRDYEAEKAGY